MTVKGKWDCFILVWSFFALVNFFCGVSGDIITRLTGGVCLVGIIIGLFGRWGLFGGRE